MAKKTTFLSWILVVCTFYLNRCGATRSLADSQKCHQRCRLPENETLGFLEEVQQNHCVLCDSSKVRQVVEAVVFRVHIGFVVLSEESFDRHAPVIAGLLANYDNVTVLASSTLPSFAHMRNRVLQYVPCEQHQAATMHFAVERFDVPANFICEETLSTIEALACNVKNLVTMTEILEDALSRTTKILVLVVEPTFIAGRLIAEKRLMVSLSLVDDAQTLRILLGPPSQQTIRDPPIFYQSLSNMDLQHQSLSTVLYHFIQDRVSSLRLTSTFINYNRARRVLGLAPVRRLSQIWRSGLLASLVSQTDDWRYEHPHLVPFANPLVPLCFACDPAADEIAARAAEEHLLITEENVILETPIVLVAAHEHLQTPSLAELRRLSKGLATARSSLQAIEAKCRTHPVPSISGLCRMKHFQVFRIGRAPNHTMFPEFVHSLPGTIWDGLGVSKNVDLIIVNCYNRDPWEAYLGRPVMCWNPQWTAIEFALAFLRQLHYSEFSAIDPVVGYALEDLVAILERTYGIAADGQGRWKQGSNIFNDVVIQLMLYRFRKPPPQWNFLGWLIVPAWMIVILAVVYIWGNDTTTWQRFRLRRSHRMAVEGPSLLDDFLAQLPELTEAWTNLREWGHAQWQDIAKHIPASPTTVSAATNHVPSRKRRGQKKRH